MNKSNKTRTEADTMGAVQVPSWAYWGAQTQRAVRNFGVSNKRIPEALIQALGQIKRYSAEVNGELGLIESDSAKAIIKAAEEVLEGRWNEHFPVDVFQTGSGTSWNMNMNEVLSNRANEILGFPMGGNKPVHPNDHVNRGQSSNDVIPSAINIADTHEAENLIQAMIVLKKAMEAKAREFKDIIKIGRTHLQDAVPMTLGQEFSGYAEQVSKGIKRLQNVLPNLYELAIGGTAIGTGINTHPDFGSMVVQRIADHTGKPFCTAENYFEAIAARDAQSELSGVLNTISGSLMKIGNDLRFLSSGPRAGLGEIILPALQPGSSIMPGKVNPVIPEMVIQAAAHVMGKCHAVNIGAHCTALELNIMMPLIAYETISSLKLLSRTCRAFSERCILGIEADKERCAHWVEWSLALVTPLAARLGYDQAAAIAYQAINEKKTVRHVLAENNILSKQEIDEVLDPESMIRR